MLPKHSLKGLSDLEITGLFLLETLLLFLLPFLFNAQGTEAKTNLLYMNSPPPVRKEVLQ